MVICFSQNASETTITYGFLERRRGTYTRLSCLREWKKYLFRNPPVRAKRRHFKHHQVSIGVGKCQSAEKPVKKNRHISSLISIFFRLFRAERKLLFHSMSYYTQIVIIRQLPSIAPARNGYQTSSAGSQMLIWC